MRLRLKSSLYRITEEVWQRLPERTFCILPSDHDAAVEIVWPESYTWPMAAVWLEPIRLGLQALAPVRRAPMESPYAGVYHFDLRFKGLSYRIAIDISDYMEINEEQAKSVFTYFKMQYRKDGYPFPNVFPGGFGPGSYVIYRYLPFLRHLRDHFEVRHDVTGRYGLQFAESIRKRAIDKLVKQTKLKYAGAEKVRYSQSLLEIARSKICIDLPGNGPLCFRLVDYMAIGSCIIAYPHGAKLQKTLLNGVHLVYMQQDLSDLIDLCEYYANNAFEREKLCQASRLYFDTHLHHTQLARYYLSTVFQMLTP